MTKFPEVFLTCSIPKFLSSAIGDRHVGQWGKRGKQSMQTRWPWIQFSFQTCCMFHLGALFDGRGDMVEADRALEECEQGVGVDGAQLQARLLHQHWLHPPPLSSWVRGLKSKVSTFNKKYPFSIRNLESEIFNFTLSWLMTNKKQGGAMSLIWSKADSCGVASRGTAVVEKVIKWFQLEISQCYKPFDQRLIPKWIQLNQWIPPTIELSFICLVCFQGRWLSLAVWFLERCRRRPCVMNILMLCIVSLKILLTAEKRNPFIIGHCCGYPHWIVSKHTSS